MEKNVLTSIVIPCFNEEKNIKALVKRFGMICREYKVELILVDNGSTDHTREEIIKYARKYAFLVPVVVIQNQGYGYGILEGLKKAKGNYMGWMHGDLQSDPKVFCSMIQAAQYETGDFFYKGKRKDRPIGDLMFTLGMSIFETLYLKQWLWDINAQPTLFSRKFYETWTQAPKDFSLDLFAYYRAKVAGLSLRRFPSRQFQRYSGTSTWNTGMAARLKIIKRVLAYSRRLKKNGRGDNMCLLHKRLTP